MKVAQTNANGTIQRSKRRTIAKALLFAISAASMSACATSVAMAATTGGAQESAQCQLQARPGAHDDRVVSNDGAEHRQGWNVDYPSQRGPEELPVSCEAFPADAMPAAAIAPDHRHGWNEDYPSQLGPQELSPPGAASPSGAISAAHVHHLASSDDAGHRQGWNADYPSQFGP
jgi:hypothetical protein